MVCLGATEVTKKRLSFWDSAGGKALGKALGEVASQFAEWYLHKKEISQQAKVGARQAAENLRRATGQVSPYDLLGLTPDAEMEVIRVAYKALAKKLHPDLGGSEEAMRRLNEAYGMICSERGEKR